MEQAIIGIEFRGKLDEKGLSRYLGNPVCNMEDSSGYHPLSYQTKGPDMGFNLEGKPIEDGDFLTLNPDGGDPNGNIVLFQVRYEHNGFIELSKTK